VALFGWVGLGKAFVFEISNQKTLMPSVAALKEGNTVRF
jgi:hypothetical protein